jgi:hypothetical protein
LYELVIRIQQRVFRAFDHPLHRPQADGGEVGEKGHEAGLDPRAARTPLSFVVEFFCRARESELVERAYARELRLVEVDGALARDLTMKEARRKSSRRDAKACTVRGRWREAPEVDPVSRLSATTRNPLSENVVSLSFATNLAYLPALFGVLQDDAASMIINNAPFFDLL